MSEKAQDIDVEWIASNMQAILNKVHSNSYKLQIDRRRSDRLRMACPICGDSHKNPKEKRAYLFFSNLHFKCQNEGCFSTFTRLCKDYDISLDPEKKLNLINWVDQNVKVYKKNQDALLFETFDRAIKFTDLEQWFKDGLGPLKAFGPVSFGSKVWCTLKERGFSDHHMSNFYEGIKVSANGKWSEPYMIFLNKVGDRILGMQERNLKKGEDRKFKIWTFGELYRNMYGSESLDPIEEISYNKVGQLFNIFNVNFEKPITIFEGYLDSLFFPNSIGAVGLNTDVSFMTNNELELRFFFDNDNPGKRKAKEWLLKGEYVFLWDKYLEDWAKKQDGEYYQMINFAKREVKDLNDAMLKLGVKSHEELLPYFSNSELDIMWITDDIKPSKKDKYKKDPESIHDINWDSKINDLKK